ncbi:DUF6587 family protein [Luteimonas sp. FCS-9]|uniref:DUF6587 family protein n=1 Tax=Luteimonas sp. FCS-9 TaxID=1547516 RepID=UPI00063E7BD6|nr:DUF6587 family protein [Luteimonas sp. FCS-9]KLJ02929.1 hypothetical protein WQ56_01290 [Luteimonas sp. FCS-9]
MSAGPDPQLVAQYAAVAVLVVVSAWIVLKKQAPAAARRLRIALAVPLVRAGRPAWMQALGRRIAPAPRPGAGCGGCDGCG